MIFLEVFVLTIYIIKQGDSLWAIARRFGVTMESINTANGLQDLPYLVVGQALVIPTTETAYRVRPGDTLWSIAARFRVSMGSIVELNDLDNPNQIYPGMVLRIPELSKNFGYIETNAYIEPSTTQNETTLTEEAAPYLTYISPFSYQVNPDGSIKSINDSAILATAREFRTAPLMVLTNFRNGNFDTEMVDAILKSEALQKTLD